MALIQCPKCKKTFSNTANKCPNCGHKRKNKTNSKFIIKGIVFICICLLSTSLLVIFKNTDNYKSNPLFIKEISTKETEVTTEKKTEQVEETETIHERETLVSRDRSDYDNIDITYEMLARTPEKYTNQPIKLSGTITQIVPTIEKGVYSFRMNVDNDYNQNLMVAYEEGVVDFNLLEDDNVTIYGRFAELMSYESTFGGTITVPLVVAVMIDVNENSIVSDCSVELPQFPVTVNEIDWEGSIAGTYSIENITYKFEKSYDGSYHLELTFQGMKNYEGSEYSWNTFGYKLYDAEGYVVDSGNVHADKIQVGEKFRNLEKTIYDLKPGVYRLELTDSQ